MAATQTQTQSLVKETLELPPSGIEVFTHFSLEKDHFYEFICSGVFTWWEYGLFFSLKKWMCDPAFLADTACDFTEKIMPDRDPHIHLFGEGPLHPNILIHDGDRSTHVYRMVFNAHKTERAGFRIICPRITERRQGGFEVKILERPDLLQAERARQLQEEQAEREREEAKQRQREERLEAERRQHEAEVRAQTAREAEARAREREAERERTKLEAQAAWHQRQEERERRAHALQVQRENDWRTRVEKQNARFSRFRDTVLMYKDFAHYQDEVWIEAYARKHLEELIENREQILKTLLTFHADGSFIDLLKTRNPEIYERAIWRSKALAKAEQFEVHPHRERPKLTPEEYRERKARWIKLKANDAIAMQQARHQSIEEHREFLNQYDLTDEERAEYEAEFLDELFKANGDQNSKKGTRDYETVS